MGVAPPPPSPSSYSFLALLRSSLLCLLLRLFSAVFELCVFFSRYNALRVSPVPFVRSFFVPLSLLQLPPFLPLWASAVAAARAVKERSPAVQRRGGVGGGGGRSSLTGEDSPPPLSLTLSLSGPSRGCESPSSVCFLPKNSRRRRGLKRARQERTPRVLTKLFRGGRAHCAFLLPPLVSDWVCSFVSFFFLFPLSLSCCCC